MNTNPKHETTSALGRTPVVVSLRRPGLGHRLGPAALFIDVRATEYGVRHGIRLCQRRTGQGELYDAAKRRLLARLEQASLYRGLTALERDYYRHCGGK